MTYRGVHVRGDRNSIPVRVQTAGNGPTCGAAKRKCSQVRRRKEENERRGEKVQDMQRERGKRGKGESENGRERKERQEGKQRKEKRINTRGEKRTQIKEKARRNRKRPHCVHRKGDCKKREGRVAV